MRKVKVNAMVVVAIAIAVMTMSFKYLGHEEKATDEWFELIGADPENPSDYSSLEGLPLPDCPTGGTVCIIRAAADEYGQPLIDENLENEIKTAMQQRTHPPNVLVKP